MMTVTGASSGTRCRVPEISRFLGIVISDEGDCVIVQPLADGQLRVVRPLKAADWERLRAY